MRWTTYGDRRALVTARRYDQPPLATVLAKWRWYKRYSRRARLWCGAVEGLAIVTSASIPATAAADADAPAVAVLAA
jgi:hypothetical protein